LLRYPFLLAGALAMAAAIGSGCGADPPPPAETPEAPVKTEKKEPVKAPEKKPDGKSSGAEGPSGVNIDQRIVDLCQLEMPRFDFDSAAVSPAAAKALDALADCFINGKAKGKGMSIVGHADERGETMYNFGLGQRRAGSVATYLQKKGMAQDKLKSWSRGELDATGKDDDGWARDRRVDILLAE
jgi:peptidoglycan-associated lipoprotein